MSALLTALVRRSTELVRPIAQAYAEGNMIAQVKVTRPAKPVFDRSTGGTAAMQPGETVHEGAGRIYNVTGPTEFSLGDEPAHFSSAYVSIPITADRPRIDDLVKILAHPDPNVVGREFRVTDVEAGGQIPVVHRMLVVGVQPSRETEA